MSKYRTKTDSSTRVCGRLELLVLAPLSVLGWPPAILVVGVGLNGVAASAATPGSEVIDAVAERILDSCCVGPGDPACHDLCNVTHSISSVDVLPFIC